MSFFLARWLRWRWGWQRSLQAAELISLRLGMESDKLYLDFDCLSAWQVRGPQAKRCALGVEEVVRKYSLCGAARYSVFLGSLALLFHQAIRRDSSLSMF